MWNNVEPTWKNAGYIRVTGSYEPILLARCRIDVVRDYFVGVIYYWKGNYPTVDAHMKKCICCYGYVSTPWVHVLRKAERESRRCKVMRYINFEGAASCILKICPWTPRFLCFWRRSSSSPYSMVQMVLHASWRDWGCWECDCVGSFSSLLIVSSEFARSRSYHPTAFFITISNHICCKRAITSGILGLHDYIHAFCVWLSKSLIWDLVYTR
jgi:hypothetical protein